jgi:hypothetical protein
MSWHISQALMTVYENSLSSRERAGESLGECSLDGEQFAPLKSNPTPSGYLSSDRMTAFSRLSRFGMTFAPLTDTLGADVLTWFLAASPAKTFPQQEKAPESPENDPASGKSLRGSLAKYDPDSASWKTHQYSLLGGLTLFSETWPRWGIMRDGELFPQPTPVLRISGDESGYWPTPAAMERGAVGDGEKYVTSSGGVRRRNADGSTSNLGLSHAVRMWPTPCTRDWKGANAEDGLTRQDGKSRMDQLPNAVNFSTPQSRDFRTGQTERYENPDRTKNLNDQIGGQLNPDWVEWLMGWIPGLTTLHNIRILRVHIWRKMNETKFSPPPSATDVRSEGMPCLWFKQNATPASLGHEPREQRSEQHPNTLRELPRQSTHEAKSGAICPRSTVCCLREDVQAGAEAKGESLFTDMLGGNGENLSIQAMGCGPIEGGLCLLREAIHADKTESADLLTIMWEQASMGKTQWQEEPPIPRVATGIPARVDRLKAIGNGQCPQAMALAWNILSEGLI